MALSPDGRFLAFTATRDGQMRLWIQPLDSTSARELPGTERAHLPFWSADSRSIGFFAGGKLKRVDADGGRLQTLADAPTPQGGTWNHDEVILFSPGSGAIYKIAAAGGTPVVVRAQDPGRQETINAPHFLADGKRFVYWTGSPNAEVVGVYAGSLDDPNMKVRIGKLDSWAIPTRTKAGQDYLIWARNDTVIAQPWDPVSARLIGEAVTLGGPCWGSQQYTGASRFRERSSGLRFARRAAIDVGRSWRQSTRYCRRARFSKLSSIIARCQESSI
jgi:eukaryotic-like serine/threonine-protein kinase